MEESKPTETCITNGTNEIPQPTTQDPPQNTQSSGKKNRANEDLQLSYYFKVRALVQQLRPHFVEVIEDPDFRNSRAAGELQKQMKLVMELYNEMVAEVESPGKAESECHPFSGKSMFGKHSLDKHQDGKLTKLVEIKQPLEKFAEKEPLPSSSPLTWLDDSHIRGSYVVGGSPFGWNFMTFSGSKPVYYGVTKEAFRRTRRTWLSQNDI